VLKHDSGADAATFRLDLDPARPSELVILKTISGGHYYEPDITSLMLRAIQPGDTVLDIGANIGVFTLLASRLAGTTGRVVAFEPAPEVLQRLTANLARNDSGNVMVVEQPVSDRIEDTVLYLNSDNEGGHSLWDPGQFPFNNKSRMAPRPMAIRTTTIDAEIARLNLRPPKVIKIDTEGAEHRVLAGAAGLLKGFKAPYIVAELHEFGLGQMGSSPADLRAFMASLGYETFLLSWDGSLPKLVPQGTTIVSSHFVNVLFSTIEAVGALWPSEYVVSPLEPPTPSKSQSS
jgi:FkbM family methyltransferase